MTRYSSRSRRDDEDPGCAAWRRRPAAPPSASSAKLPSASATLKVPVTAAATAKRNSTRPVASFSRLSPSSRMDSRCGRCTRCSTARADDRIGRRDDGAQRRARRPRQRRQQPVRHHRDHHGGEHHRADRQRQDADEVPAQVAQWDEPGAIHQQRRQEDDEHQLRIERDERQTRHEGERRAADDQRDRRRQTQPVGEVVQRDDREQHRDQQFEQCGRVHQRAGSASQNRSIRPRIAASGSRPRPAAWLSRR